MTKWDDTSWQKEFLEMKSHSLSDVKLLTEGVKGLKGASLAFAEYWLDNFEMMRRGKK